MGALTFGSDFVTGQSGMYHTLNERMRFLCAMNGSVDNDAYTGTEVVTVTLVDDYMAIVSGDDYEIDNIYDSPMGLTIGSDITTYLTYGMIVAIRGSGESDNNKKIVVSSYDYDETYAGKTYISTSSILTAESSSAGKIWVNWSTTLSGYYDYIAHYYDGQWYVYPPVYGTILSFNEDNTVRMYQNLKSDSSEKGSYWKTITS